MAAIILNTITNGIKVAYTNFIELLIKACILLRGNGATRLQKSKKRKEAEAFIRPPCI
jgi:hypothetical protein